MHKAFFGFIVFVFVSCVPKVQRQNIPYILPYNVTMRLEKEYKDEKFANAYCVLGQECSNYSITLVTYKSPTELLDGFQRVKNTSRFLLIGDKWWPLLFKMDYSFSTTPGLQVGDSTAREILFTETGIPHSYVIHDYCLTIYFDENGKIISENYGAIMKKN